MLLLLGFLQLKAINNNYSYNNNNNNLPRRVHLLASIVCSKKNGGRRLPRVCTAHRRVACVQRLQAPQHVQRVEADALVVRGRQLGGVAIVPPHLPLLLLRLSSQLLAGP